MTVARHQQRRRSNAVRRAIVPGRRATACVAVLLWLVHPRGQAPSGRGGGVATGVEGVAAVLWYRGVDLYHSHGLRRVVMVALPSVPHHRRRHSALQVGSGTRERGRLVVPAVAAAFQHPRRGWCI